MVASSRTPHNKKRHGKHQKHTKNFLSVYLPYVPLLLIVTTGLVFTSYWQPRSKHGVLAYSTSMSINALLATTNQQRADNGAAGLTLNSQLSSAAQAKANDMVARDYWAHNTPDGNPPWVFIDNAGYSYKKAGENLAYGFSTSDDTITGWMNSPSHRENMLDAAFADVGFGFANSANFVGTGEETIVVAEYGTPLNGAPAAAVAPTPTPPPKPQTKAATETAPVATPTPAPAPPPVTAPVAVPTKTETKKSDKPVTTDTKQLVEPKPKHISRLATLTGNSLPWLTTLASITAITGIAVLSIKHGYALRKLFIKSERYVLHHTLFDVTIVSLIGLCFIVSQSAGVIR
jgi:hypothetical protein